MLQPSIIDNLTDILDTAVCRRQTESNKEIKGFKNKYIGFPRKLRTYLYMKTLKRVGLSIFEAEKVGGGVLGRGGILVIFRAIQNTESYFSLLIENIFKKNSRNNDKRPHLKL